MDLFGTLRRFSNLTTQLLSRTYCPIISSVHHASGRWWPQPAKQIVSSRAQFCMKVDTVSSDIIVSTSNGDVRLVKEDAAPIYYKPKSEGKTGFDLVPWKNGEKIANYVLFEASMAKVKVSWKDYSNLSSDERAIYMAHLKAVEERKLTYKDPFTGYFVFTVCHHLHRGKCCGSGCRHCPYKHENATDSIRKSKVWNGAYYT